MPYPRLPEEEQERIRHEYRRLKSVHKVRSATGYNLRTILKYCRPIMAIKVDHNVIMAAFRLTGDVARTAQISGVSERTVRRACEAAGVTLVQGAKDANRLYRSMRERVADSDWKERVFNRDGDRCCRCGNQAQVVHHVYRLAVMRDDVFRENSGIDPYKSRKELSRFLDLIMEKHTLEVGESLCGPCHKAEHNGSSGHQRSP